MDIPRLEWWKPAGVILLRKQNHLQSLLFTFLLVAELLISNFQCLELLTPFREYTEKSWAGCKWIGKELKVTGWLSRSKFLQGLWFLWMALKEKGGRAVISEWSQRWSGAWQWPWPTYAEMWEGGLRTTEGLACLPRQRWELSAGWAFLLFQEDWGNSRGSSRQIPVCLCFVLLSVQTRCFWQEM